MLILAHMSAGPGGLLVPAVVSSRRQAEVSGARQAATPPLGNQVLARGEIRPTRGPYAHHPGCMTRGTCTARACLGPACRAHLLVTDARLPARDGRRAGVWGKGPHALQEMPLSYAARAKHSAAGACP